MSNFHAQFLKQHPVPRPSDSYFGLRKAVLNCTLYALYQYIVYSCVDNLYLMKSVCSIRKTLTHYQETERCEVTPNPNKTCLKHKQNCVAMRREDPCNERGLVKR